MSKEKRNISKDEPNKCACGLYASEFTFGITSIRDMAGEVYVHEPYKLPPSIIVEHTKIADAALINLEQVGIHCGIDVKPEGERLISMMGKLVQINNMKINTEIRNDTAAIIDGVRTKLLECKKERMTTIR